jgi:hypothetical protein
MRYISRKSQWVRCGLCGYCNYIRWTTSIVNEEGEYISTGCRICRYESSRGIYIQSLVNRLRMEYDLELGKEVDGPEEPVKAALELFSNSHGPEVLRECYEVATAEFMTMFTRMWVRSLQSKARNR